MAFLYPDTGLPPFFMYPRFLLETNLNDTARLVYILLLDRARLSQTNPQWQDETGRVFVYYTIPHLAEAAGRGQTGVKAALGQLEEAGLILRKRQGMGNPSRIYIRIPSENRPTIRPENRPTILPENRPAIPSESRPAIRPENRPAIPSENRPAIRSEKTQVTVGKPTPNHNKRNNKKINNYIIKGLDYSYEEGESL